MDFKELMKLASQNKSQGKKQQERKESTTKTSSGASKESGVSQAAVQAFLAKKEIEKKEKEAEEKAAKQARIQERLAKSLGTKRKVSAKATKSGATSNEEEKKQHRTIKTNEEKSSRISEKQKSSEQRSSKTSQQSSSSKKLEADRKLSRPATEPESKNRDIKSNKKPVHKGQQNAKKGATLSFKELLAVAERNRNGGVASQPALDRGSRLKNGEDNEDSKNKVKKKNAEDKFVKDTGARPKETTVSDSKRLTKPGPNGKSVKDSSIKKDLKRPSGLMNGNRERQLPSKVTSSIAATSSDRKMNNSKYSNSVMERTPMKNPSFGLKRDRANLKRKMNPYDDLDDFIDDGSGQEDDDAPDVSKYIREIFGYDRRRFRDDDDDLSCMESNYRQIEREEQKSAKIAKLEDEIEHLKELAELKEQRDKLRKKSKK